jgi:hypothetical protein
LDEVEGTSCERRSGRPEIFLRDSDAEDDLVELAV